MAAMIDVTDKDKYPKTAALGLILLEMMSTSLDIWRPHLLRIQSAPWEGSEQTMPNRLRNAQ
jgi:hypothetical protein